MVVVYEFSVCLIGISHILFQNKTNQSKEAYASLIFLYYLKG
jgi:hypothetical protein